MNSSLTINKWLTESTNKLKRVGIATARLDCLVLLEDTISINRSLILAHPEYLLQTKVLKQLNDQIARRQLHEPLSYIRGKAEFYGREFQIDHRVLEPRPESETIIDLLKQLPPSNKIIITDIGTGSGALAITVKLEFPKTQVIATDIDPGCLKLARINAQKLHTVIRFQLGDLLYPLTKINFQQLIVLCNLPYVPNNFQINPAALREPRQAIFGGQDGLDIYRRLFLQLLGFNNLPVIVLTESLPSQHLVLSAIAKESNYRLQKSEGFIQQFSNI